MQELSARSEVPVSTIKFYLRDGLLPAGRSTARNQADYGQEHVDRLRLLRILTKIGKLPTDTVKLIVELLGDKWANPATVGAECAMLAAPAVSVDQVRAAAAELGMPLDDDVFGEYIHAAEIMERAEIGMCADMDETGPLLAAVLGDALIVALRHELRVGEAQ